MPDKNLYCQLKSLLIGFIFFTLCSRCFDQGGGSVSLIYLLYIIDFWLFKQTITSMTCVIVWVMSCACGWFIMYLCLNTVCRVNRSTGTLKFYCTLLIDRWKSVYLHLMMLYTVCIRMETQCVLFFSFCDFLFLYP